MKINFKIVFSLLLILFFAFALFLFLNQKTTKTALNTDPEKKSINDALPDNQSDYVFHEMKMVEISGSERFWEINAQESAVQKHSIFLTQVSGYLFAENKPSVWYEAPFGRIKMRDRFFYLYRGFLKTIPPHPYWKLTADNIFLLPASGKIQAEGNPKLESKQVVATSTLIYTKTSFNDFIMQNNSQILQMPHGEIKAATLNADQIMISRQTEVFSASENVKFFTPSLEAFSQYAQWNRQQNVLTLSKQVKLNGPEKSTITSQKALIDETNQLVTLNEKVEFRQEEIYVQSDVAVWKRKENKVEFFGTVKAYQKNREFLGEQIYVDLKAKRLLSVGRSKLILDKNPTP